MADPVTTKDTPLRLRARSPDDIAVVSSCLQDAIAPIVDMTYEPARKRFVMVVNRFKWEAGAVDPAAEGGFETDEDDELPPDASAYRRTNCGIRIHGVTSVRRKEIDLADRGAILNMLAVRAEPSTVYLDFSGGASLALTIEALDILIEDLGEPWLTFRKPDHTDADEAVREREPAGQPQ